MHLHKNTYIVMRRLQNSPPKPCVPIISVSNCLLTNPIEIRQNFQAHLTTLNKGIVADFNGLMDMYVQASVSFDVQDSIDVIEYIPSPPVLAGFCASVKRDKANVEDCVPGNVSRDNPHEFAVALAPVVAKTMASFQEPVTWLEGIAHEILMSAGDVALAKNHRFVLLTDIPGKIYHSYLRSCLLPHINSYILHSMCGGFLRRGAGFASIYFFNFVEFARSARMQWAALFLDVSAAFESLQYFFVMTGPISDQQACAIFDKCNMSRNIFTQFLSLIKSNNAFVEAGVPSVLAKLIHSAHIVSWSSWDGLNSFLVAQQGAKAGDPLGDILFAFLICKVLRKTREVLEDNNIYNNLTVSAPDGLFGPACNNSINLASINYVDDNGFPLMAETPAQLLTNVQSLAELVLDSFAGFLLNCSLAAQKTAVLLCLIGKNKNNIYSSLVCHNKHFFLPIKVQAKGECEVPIVRSYKHVGFIQTGRQIVNNPDIFERIAKQKGSLRELASNVLANPRLPAKVRSEFALIPKAKMLSNAHLWHNMSDVALAALDAAYNNIHRLVNLCKFGRKASSGPPLSTSQLYTAHPVKNVLACIRARRLRELVRVITLAPDELRWLMGHNAAYQKSYAHQLQEDLAWLFEFWNLSDSCTLPPPTSNPNLFHWFNFISNNPAVVYKKIKTCEEADIFPLPFKEKQQTTELVTCPHCGLEMAKYQLEGHLSKVHKKRNPLKPYVEGSVCFLCLRDFQTRVELFNHLCYHSCKCKQFYLTQVPKLDPETFEAEEKATAVEAKRIRLLGRRPLWSELPITRIPGPLLPIMYIRNTPKHYKNLKHYNKSR